MELALEFALFDCRIDGLKHYTEFSLYVLTKCLLECEHPII